MIELIPNDINSLKDLVLSLTQENVKLKSENSYLNEMVQLIRRQHYAPKSEKWVSDDQLSIFNEVEELAAKPEEDEEETVDVKGHTRVKKPRRKSLPDNLPREHIIVDLDEDKRFCQHDGEPLHKIGEDIVEKMEVVPAKITVKVYHIIKYGCDKCETGVTTAPRQEELLEKSFATPSLLSTIISYKYIYGLPLYRIEQMFTSFGVELSRATMARWVVKVGDKARVLVNLMQDDLLASDYLQADETRTQVLKEKGKKAQSKSYMWLVARPGPDPIIIFHYDPSRSSEVPKQLLDGYKGYLQVDGYAGYDAICLSNFIVRVGCWDHCRRKFFEAAKGNNSSIGKRAINLIDRLYAIERQIADKTPEEKKQIRADKAKPVLEKLESWMNEIIPKTANQSLAGKALLYMKNEWANLNRYLEDGRIMISNAFIENKVRPFAIGRKNWLFSDTVAGAEASEALYSLVETAKANDLDPQWYLNHIFTHLPLAKTVAEFEALLPYNLRKIISKNKVAEI